MMNRILDQRLKQQRGNRYRQRIRSHMKSYDQSLLETLLLYLHVVFEEGNLKAERIDHGVRCTEDAALVERLAREGVPLTVCPLSNVKLCVFPNLQQHNLKQLLAAGLRVTVNSDDPAYFGGYVNDNFTAAQQALDLSRDDLHRLAKNSFLAAFIAEAHKKRLCAALEAYCSAH